MAPVCTGFPQENIRGLAWLVINLCPISLGLCCKNREKRARLIKGASKGTIKRTDIVQCFVTLYSAFICSQSQCLALFS